MTTNPFMNDARELLESRRGCISNVTFRNLERRYSRMEHDLSALKNRGLIGSYAPSKIKAEDVKTFIIYRKERKVTASDLSHDFSALNQLCIFRGNSAATQCKQSNPGLIPKDQKTSRLDPLPESTYQAILDKYNSLDEEQLKKIGVVRAFAMVLLYICTGARTKEIANAKRTDLDTTNWILHLEHVKGEGNYGEPRNVPVPEVIVPVLEHYLEVCKEWLKTQDADISMVEPLIFKLGGDYGYLSGNGIRNIKSRVEKEIGVNFALRDCRRGFGQHYKDRDVPMEDISVLMGHATTRTTELYYCRKCESKVINDVKGVW